MLHLVTTQTPRSISASKKHLTQSLLAVAGAALAACGAPGKESSLHDHETPTTQGTMVDCNGPELPIEVKGRQGDITVTEYIFCNGLYSKDILVTFEVVNLDPKKIVFFGSRSEPLQTVSWLPNVNSSDWLSQKTSVVYLGRAPAGRERFALRQRHVGFSLPTFALRVTQGFFMQEIQF